MKSRDYSSFRDPSGFVFWENKTLYRQINNCYKDKYRHLIDSGLYEELIKMGVLVQHKEIEIANEDPDAFCIIKPDYIPFISYPYEWSFGQLKDAALLTLKIHKYSLNYGMILKDASTYNIQFVNNKAILIDTLSFDFYEEGSPWIAYGQFCRHFLAPLFLMAEVDIRLSQLLKVYIDGIPLDLASSLLKRKGGFAAKQHIHWHAKAVRKHSEDGKIKGRSKIDNIRISKFNYEALIDQLIRIVESIRLKDVNTEWMDYYDNTNYSEEAFSHKTNIIGSLIKRSNFKNIWDMGANNGYFSRLALENGVSSVIAFDVDPIAVEKNYQRSKDKKEAILPLLLDFTNPSPGIGFANCERLSIDKREKPDCILALAFIHHMAIGNNIPFEKVAENFSKLSDNLIIEFVPKEDSQVQVLLATRDDIFSDYTQEQFERQFEKYFDLVNVKEVKDSTRIVYLYKKRE